MRPARLLLIALLAGGTVAGYASGIHSLARHAHGRDAWCGRAERGPPPAPPGASNRAEVNAEPPAP